MVLGLSVSAFTTLHVIISVIAIATGLIVFYGLVARDPMARMTALFLLTTLLTSLTGFLFPALTLTPAVIFGIISVILLAAAFAGRYAFRLAGWWRLIYVVAALFALYLNVVVLIVQSFQKLSVLRALAPTQSEPPFLATQGVVLVGFVLFGFLAARRFQPVAAVA